MLSACADSPKQLIKRADELCRYIPDHELLEKSRDFITRDYYAEQDSMCFQLREPDNMDHETQCYLLNCIGSDIA